MRFLIKLSLSAAVVALSIPSVAAKIYPDDFLIAPPPEPVPAEESSPVEMTREQPSTERSEPFFFATEIPQGKLTRAQYVDAIATRLYDADTHDNCFGDLVLSETYDYDLLFRDMSLDAPYASSICVMMRNGLVGGYRDGNFRSGNFITTAEAAAILADIGGMFLRDSNHVRPGEPWYGRFMEAMRSVDREFTMQPWEIMDGAHLRHSLCVLKKKTPELDPLNEFDGC